MQAIALGYTNIKTPCNNFCQPQ